MITHVDGPRTCRCRSRCGAPHPTCPWRCGRKVESILSNAGKRRGSKAKDEIFCPACRLATLRLFGDDISESHPLPRQPFGRPTKFNGTPPDWVVDINGEEGAAPRFRPGDTSAVSPVQPRLFQPQIVWMGSVCECRAACGAKHLINRWRCGRKIQVTSNELPTGRSPKSRNWKLCEDCREETLKLFKTPIERAPGADTRDADTEGIICTCRSACGAPHAYRSWWCRRAFRPAHSQSRRTDVRILRKTALCALCEAATLHLFRGVIAGTRPDNQALPNSRESQFSASYVDAPISGQTAKAARNSGETPRPKLQGANHGRRHTHGGAEKYYEEVARKKKLETAESEQGKKRSREAADAVLEAMSISFIESCGYTSEKAPPEAITWGVATTRGNNCLIHSLLQLTTQKWSEQNTSWQLRTCENVRTQLATSQNCPKDSLLFVEDWWEGILVALGAIPEDYVLKVFTENDGAVTLGSGHRRIFMFNEDRVHFVPGWWADSELVVNNNGRAVGSPHMDIPTTSEELRKESVPVCEKKIDSSGSELATSADRGVQRQKESSASPQKMPTPAPRKLDPLPMTEKMISWSRMDGGSENDIHNTCRPLVPYRPMPDDGNVTEKNRHMPTNEIQQTGATISLLPAYRRKPLYGATFENLHTGRGQKQVVQVRSVQAHEAEDWANTCAVDARNVTMRTHLHMCTESCFKFSTNTGASRICRHNFFRVDRMIKFDEDLQKVIPVALRRRGKKLVPEPTIVTTEIKHREGRILPKRIHPFEGSTNPIGSVCLRSNFDVQCMARVLQLAGIDGEVYLKQVLECTSGPHSEYTSGAPTSIRDFKEWVKKEASAIDIASGSEAEISTRAVHALELCAAYKAMLPEIPGITTRYCVSLQPPRFSLDPDDRQIRVEEAPPDAPEFGLDILLLQLVELHRDAHDQAFYTTDYATKALPTLQPILERQRIGIEHLKEMYRETRNLSTKDLAALVLIRLQTSAHRCTHKSGVNMCFQMAFDHECFRSHRVWTVFCRNLVWSARQAWREKYKQPESSVNSNVERAPADIFCYIDDGVTGVEVPEANGAKEVKEPQMKLVATNQRDDYLHRGGHWEFVDMGIYHYAQHVHRSDFPPGVTKPSDLKPPYFSFAQHYLIRDAKCQHFNKFTQTPHNPLIEGFTMPPRAKDPDVNALFKILLFRPMRCYRNEGEPDCNKLRPYMNLCDDNGWIRVWEKWYTNEKKRAKKATKLVNNAQRAPTFRFFSTQRLQNPRQQRKIMKWYYALITTAACENMEYIAEARARPRTRENLRYAEFDEPEQALNVYTNPNTSSEAHEIDELGWDAEESNLRRPLCPVSHQQLEDLINFRLVKPTTAGKAAEIREETLRGKNPYVYTRPRDSAPDKSVPCVDFNKYLLSQREALRTRELKWGQARVGAAALDAEEAFLEQRGQPTSARWVKGEFSQKAYKLCVAKNCTEKQMDIAALAIGAICRNEEGQEDANRNIIIHGAGGTGKTHAANQVVRPIVRDVFGESAERAVTIANSAARVLGQGATTIHAAMKILARQKTDSQITDEHSRVERLEDEWRNVKLLIIDEISMIPATLYRALAYSATQGRAHAHDLNKTDWRVEPFGKIPVVLNLGDFMQLRPVSAYSLMDFHDPKNRDIDSLHVHNGWALYKAASDCVLLTENKRFRDQELPAFLESIRKPPADSRGLPEAIWKAFKDTWAGAACWRDSAEQDKRFKRAEWLDATFVAIEWQVVCREQQARCRRDAGRLGKKIYYAQACDRAATLLPRNCYYQALQYANMNKMGKLVGSLPLFVGCRVRFTHRICRAHNIVQDAAGVIVDIEFHPLENREEIGNMSRNEEGVMCMALQYMPLAVYVAIDDHIPRIHEDGTCMPGTDFENGRERGILAVEPLRVATDAISIRTSATHPTNKIHFTRIQIPLVPEAIRTTYSVQGVTADKLIVDCTRPSWLKGRIDADHEYWMHLYVMLSRARRMQDMLVINPPSQEELLVGPPPSVLAEIQRLRELDEATTLRADAERVYLNWPARSGRG